VKRSSRQKKKPGTSYGGGGNRTRDADCANTSTIGPRAPEGTSPDAAEHSASAVPRHGGRRSRTIDYAGASPRRRCTINVDAATRIREPNTAVAAIAPVPKSDDDPAVISREFAGSAP